MLKQIHFLCMSHIEMEKYNLLTLSIYAEKQIIRTGMCVTLFSKKVEINENIYRCSLIDCQSELLL